MIYVIAKSSTNSTEIFSKIFDRINSFFFFHFFFFFLLKPGIGSTVESRQNPGQLQQNINTKEEQKIVLVLSNYV